MLPQHLHKVHGIPLNEIYAHLPPTYRRRTRSKLERDEAAINDDDNEDEEEVDDVEEVEGQSDEVQSSDRGNKLLAFLLSYRGLPNIRLGK